MNLVNSNILDILQHSFSKFILKCYVKIIYLNLILIRKNLITDYTPLNTMMIYAINMKKIYI